MRQLVEQLVDQRNESITGALVTRGPLAQETADIGGGRCDLVLPALGDASTIGVRDASGKQNEPVSRQMSF